MEQEGASPDDLRVMLGRGRAKLGMFEGDLEKGELEIGQVASLINEILPVETIIKNMLQEYHETRERMNKEDFEF